MIGPLNNGELVGLHVFSSDKPGCITEILEPADPNTLALAEGIKHEALMRANHLTGFCDDLARLGFDIGLQEIRETPFTDKADAS